MEALSQRMQLEQRELQQAMLEMQQLEMQYQESHIVQKEFKGLADDAKIYKLIGPVLVPQDKAEADSNVSKRLEFITQQKKQAEAKIEQLQKSMQKTQVEFREQQIKAAVPQKQ